MSVNNKVLGLIFASMHDANLLDLTKHGTMGSVPIGGRYRLVDFPLSNMVNSGITDVGVITKANYISLLDHLGAGREWDLTRKHGGLHLLPPYISGSNGGIYEGRLDALNNISAYLEKSSAKYIVCANCDVMSTIDYRPIITKHIDSEADITLIYGKGEYDFEKNKDEKYGTTILSVVNDDEFESAMLKPPFKGPSNIWLESFIISRDKLEEIVSLACSLGKHSFTKFVLQEHKEDYKIKCYKVEDEFKRIGGFTEYWEANRMLLDSEKRQSFFRKNMPILTKVGDSAPVKYGIGTVIKNSLIADGCIIEGNVENSIIFRGVKVGKDAVVKDCILLEGTTIGEKAYISGIVTDINGEIKENRRLDGELDKPLLINN